MKMKLSFFSSIVAITIFLVSCSSSDESEPKGKLFIIGGGSRPADLVARMVDEAKLRDGGYLVILPMATAESDSAIIWSGEQFLKQGINNVVGFNFKPNEVPNPQWIDSLKNASLIYISGGNQNKFMEIVLNTPIFDAIHDAYKNGAVIAGTSAGAAVMSKLMITGNELRGRDYRSTFPVIESENLELAQGLGLLPNAIIDQHFVWRSRHNRLITAVIEHPELPGIGIDESTAILVTGNRAEVVGESQVLVFRNKNQSKRVANNKLGANGLSLDIYLPGEMFDIN
jgi:cyanophycinase